MDLLTIMYKAFEQTTKLLKNSDIPLHFIFVSVAAAVLSPTPEMEDGHWHQDPNTSVPLLMQATHQIVHHGT